ncbi:MAG: oligopeptide transporter, OPT family [Candidatus Zixiibacteriota bacterium]|nr:MAG: oligopeptide transporter, OPT family [candidate division Zixibacteria bacterium]
MEEPEYKPYIGHHKELPEFTWKSIIIGTILGIVFAWANAYVGLISGLTISASIPVSVMSVALFAFLHKFLKTRRGSPLETNMSQTIGSAGESLAAGVIFTIPAMFLLGWDQAYGIQVITITIIAAIGGILGVSFMIPLRKFLVKREHKVLPFPEGTACAEVIKSADIGGTSAKFVFTGLGVGGFVELIKNGFSVFEGLIRVPTLIVNKMVVSLEVNPALLGVGYILRRRISAIMVAGGAVAWIILIPLIAAFGDKWGMFRFLNEQAQATLAAGGVFAIAEMSPDQIWNYFIRYIGAGAVAFGGIVTLIKSIPTIVESFRLGSKELMAGADRPEKIRTDRDLSIKIVLWISAIVIVLLGLAFTFGLEQISAGTSILAAILVVIFAFFFVTVASRIVGLVGSTSSPVSGMTIATLLGTSIIFVAFGLTTGPAKIAALTIGAVVCMAACTSGDVAQDLKTGFLVGATPRKQQMGELIGVLTSAAILGFTLMMLYNAYGFAGAPSPITGKAELPAPQATLMSLVVKGVMDQNIPWILVGVGAVIAMIFEFFKVPSLPAAVGLYLPLETTTPIFAGGLLRHYRDKKAGAKPTDTDNGVLFSSGLVAGVGVIGILLAIVAVIPAGEIFVLDAMRLPLTNLWATIPGGNIFSMILAAIIFIILMIMLNQIAKPRKD